MSEAEVQIAEGVSSLSPCSLKYENSDVSARLLEECQSLAELGVGLWYCFMKRERRSEGPFFLGSDHSLMDWWQRLRQDLRECREKRALFPLPSLWEKVLHEFPCDRSLSEVLSDVDLVMKFGGPCWSELAVCFCNRLHGCLGTLGVGKPSKPQTALLESVERSVVQVLKDDVRFSWREQDILSDFDKKLLSYTGEEIPKAEPLSCFRVAAALPPEGHGGCIKVEDFLMGKTKWYLLNPRSCIVEDEGQQLPKLQSKVHIRSGEELSLARLLVSRGICTWVPDREVLRFRGERVLNGMFGIAKNKILSNGESSLRCIMNLIPSNSVLRPIRGRVHHLPHICQWLHVSLSDEEEVRLCQSDMVSAFYLFSLGDDWARQLCFNLSATGEQLGLEQAKHQEVFYLGCRVLPMGWSSAVGIMQCIAEEVLFQGNIPRDTQLRRGTLASLGREEHGRR